MHAAGAQIFLHPAAPRRRSRGRRRRRSCSAKIGKSPEMLVGQSDDCGPSPAASAPRRQAHRGVGIEQIADRAAARWRHRRATARDAASAPASASRTSIIWRVKLSGCCMRAIGLLDLGARLADDRPEGERHLLAGRHAHLPAQRQDRVEHEAGAAGQPGARLQRRRIGDRAAAAEEGAAVGLGLGDARRAGAVVDEMRKLDRPARSGERGRRRAKMTRLSAPISVSTNILENAGWALSSWLGGQHQFGKGGHLDEAVGVAVVPERDAPAFAVALADDDALDLGAQRADRLEEAGLLVAEMRLRLLAVELLSARRWPTTIRRSRRRAGT